MGKLDAILYSHHSWVDVRPAETTDGLAAGRSRRVMLLVALLLVVNIFDLACTLQALRAGGFHENNPVARAFIHNPASLTAFKMGLLLPALAVLVTLRRYRVTEVASWALGLAFVALSLVWQLYWKLCF